jgi:hypothetical protein
VTIDNILASLFPDGHDGWSLVGRTVSGRSAGGGIGPAVATLAGKQRLAFLILPKDIVSIATPPSLGCVRRVAPRPWWPGGSAELLAMTFFVDACERLPRRCPKQSCWRSHRSFSG